MFKTDLLVVHATERALVVNGVSVALTATARESVSGKSCRSGASARDSSSRGRQRATAIVLLCRVWSRPIVFAPKAHQQIAAILSPGALATHAPPAASTPAGQQPRARRALPASAPARPTSVRHPIAVEMNELRRSCRVLDARLELRRGRETAMSPRDSHGRTRH